MPAPERLPLSDRDRTLTLVAILLALFLGAVDQTIVSTSLPRIVEDLRGLDRYAWVATAYLLASTALVPIYGKLADGYSRKRIQLAAVAVFLTGSVLCGLAGEFGPLPLIGDGMNQLILFRGLQGLGGAGLFALAFIVIADLYPPAVRGRYQGFVSATWAVASVAGPLAGGLLTDHAGGWIPGIEGWRWVFYVNLPLGALALWFMIRRMPALEPPDAGRGVDPTSAGLLVGGLVPIVLALQLDRRRYPILPGLDIAPTDPGAATSTLESWVTLGLILAGGVSLVAFTRRSLRAENPLLDLRLFRDRIFTTANSASFFLGAAFMGLLLFLPLFLVNVVGVSATQAGLSLIPLSLGIVAGSIAAGQIVSLVGHYRRILLVGGAVVLLGAVLLARMTPQTPVGVVTLYMILCGLGMGPSYPLYTLAVQNSVPVRTIGQATSAGQFFRQIGGTVGAAILGTVLTMSLAHTLGYVPDAIGGEPGAEALLAPGGPGEAALGVVRSAFADSITGIFLLSAVFVGLAFAITLFLPERPLRTTHDHP